MANKDFRLAVQVLRDDLLSLFELSTENDDLYLDEIADIEIALSKIEIQEKRICRR